MHQKLTYDDLDWQKLWQNARAKKTWTAKGPADWDKKAASFAKRNSDSPFVDLILDKIPLDSETTVLDGGSGPGTLALPISKKVKSVTAIDYSKGMLEVLKSRALKQNSNNIRTVLGSWEDDWDAMQIKKHDICIACRSLGVDNLKKALGKLNNFANRSVFVVDRISPTPFDNGAFAAINRPFRSGPDYIYTINTLYSMDIHPCIDIISLKKTVSFASMDEALDSYRWMFKDLTLEEDQKLKVYIQNNSTIGKNGEIIVYRPYPARWALISWNKN
jgi:SAM-dependent methyltransferase